MVTVRHVTSGTKKTFACNDDVEIVTPGVPAMSRTTQRMRELGIDINDVEVEPELENFVPQISIDQYIEQYKMCKTAEEYESLRKTILDEENTYRRLYAKKSVLKNADYLKDHDFFMIPVFGNEDIFKAQDKSCLNDVPIAFPLKKRRESGALSISTKTEFERNWRIFSERLLDIVNWDNVFVAGGSILACMLPVPPGADKNFKTLRKYYHEDVYSGSDIDLFIYGLNEEEGKNKLKEIYEAVCNEIPYNVLAFRSAYAISIVSQFPYRHIQIILRLYSSPAEILMGFDVDSCAIGYDGKQVYMVPRCHQALVRQRNTIDLSRRSPTYELRLAKYAERGFEVEVPQLTRDKIDPMIFEKPWNDIQGLARLLVLETLKTPEARYAYKERSMNKRVHMSWRRERMANDPFTKKRLEFSSDKASDYSTVFLPWGPSWTAKKIRKLMMTKDIVLNADWSEMFQQRGYHTHPCFVGTLEDVLKDQCGHCPEVPDSVDKESLECFVHGPVSFIVDDPGRQSIGSFHPITEGDWTEGTYLNEFSEEISFVANKGDLERMKNLIEVQKISIETKDYLGRTPLQIAVLSNKPEMVRYLISQGADITVSLFDSRNLLHITTQYNYVDLLDSLLTENAKRKEKNQTFIDINLISKTSCLSPYHYCILYGHMECLERLSQEPDLDFTSLVWSKEHDVGIPLLALASHVECFNPDRAIDIAKFLLDHGVSVASINSNFDNVYHFLAAYNYPVFTEYLLKNAPDSKNVINNLNSNTHSPLIISINNNNFSIAKLLLDNGARFFVIQNDLDKLDALRKHTKKQHYYSNSLDRVQQPIFYLSTKVCPQSIELIKRYISEGNDINGVYYNATILDVFKRCQKKSRQEIIDDIESSRKVNIENMEFYKKKLQSTSSDSWEYSIYLSLYNTAYDGLSSLFKGQYYSEEEVEECNKFIQYLVDHGAKTLNELRGLNEEAETRSGALGRGANTQFGFEFGFNSKKSVNAEQNSIEIDPKFLNSKGDLDQAFMFKTLENKEYSYRKFSNVSAQQTAKYIQFYQACYQNDIETVKALGTPSSGKTCVLVNSMDSLLRSPISIAVSKHYHQLLITLLDLLLLQYTPITQSISGSENNKVSNYKLLETISKRKSYSKMISEDQENEGFIDPNSDLSDIVNSVHVSAIFEEAGQFNEDIFPKDLVPILNQCIIINGYAHFGNYNQSFDIQYTNTLGDFKYTPLKEIKREYPENKKTLSISIILALFVLFTKEEIEQIFEKLVEVFNGAFEKDLKTNNLKESDRENRDKYSLYNICRINKKPGYRSYDPQYNSFYYICKMDRPELIPIFMKYVYCGLEMEMVDKSKKQVKEEGEAKRASIGTEKAEEHMEEDEDMDEEMDKDEDMDEDGEDYKEEDDESYKYVDSDEEELKQLNAFRNEKNAKSSNVTNLCHPLGTCCQNDAINCFKYLLNEQQVKKDISLFMEDNLYKLHTTCPGASVDLLYAGTFKMTPTKAFVQDLFSQAIQHSSLKIIEYLTDHVSEFNVTLKDLYEPEELKSISAPSKSGAHLQKATIMNHLTCLKFDVFKYIYTHYAWSKKSISQMLVSFSTTYKFNSNSILSYDYLIKDMLSKKEYMVMIPLFESLFSNGSYGMIVYIVQQGFPISKLSSMSSKVLHNIIQHSYMKLLHYLDDHNQDYITSTINTENEDGHVPLEVICNLIENKILNSGIQNEGSFKDREFEYNFVNNFFGALSNVPRRVVGRAGWVSKVSFIETEEDIEKTKELKRCINDKDEHPSILDTYQYVSKKIQLVPRALVKYEDVKKRTKKDTKAAKTFTSYTYSDDNEYDDEYEEDF